MSSIPRAKFLFQVDAKISLFFFGVSVFPTLFFSSSSTPTEREREREREMRVFGILVVGTLLMSLASADFAAYLNKLRLSASLSSRTLSKAGVLSHTFDGQEDGRKPWTVNNMTNDHLSCALCNQYNLPFGGNSPGFIVNVKNNHFFCYYAADGGSGSDNWCNPPGPSPTCVPGCSTMIRDNVWHPEWCTGSCQSRGPYKPEELQRFLEVDFRSINSEIIMDPTVYMENLYKPIRESSLLALVNTGHSVWRKAETDLGRKIPLIKYDKEKGDQPYSCVECPEEFDFFEDEEDEEEEEVDEGGDEDVQGEPPTTFLGPLALGDCDFSGSTLAYRQVPQFYTSGSCSCDFFRSQADIREPPSQTENCLVSFQFIFFSLFFLSFLFIFPPLTPQIVLTRLRQQVWFFPPANL